MARLRLLISPTRRLAVMLVMQVMMVVSLLPCQASAPPLLGRYAGAGTNQWLDFLPCHDGFVFPKTYLEGNLVAKPTTVEMHDWNGRLRWQVIIPAGRRSSWKEEEWTYNSAGASPDGHTLAAAVPDADKMLVYSWRDGKMAGRAVIPMARSSRNRIHTWPSVVVQNDGTVLICPRWDGTANLFLVRGNQVLATGRSASRLDPHYLGDGMSDVLIRFPSADGKVLIGFLSGGDDPGKGTYPTFERISISRQGHRLAFHAETLVTSRKVFVRVLKDGTALLQDGTVIRKTGVDTKGRGWEYAGNPMWQTWVTQRNKGKNRIYQPATGRQWLFSREFKAVACSEDGRYAAALEDEPAGLVIYELPGKERARLPLKRDGDKHYFIQDGRRCYVNQFCLSADGRRLILRAHIQDDPKREFYVYAL